MREKTKRSFILTQRKMFTCPLRVSSMAFPSFFPSLSWWREGREVTLKGIGVSQSFLFLMSPHPIQPLEAEESVQHFHKGPLTQRSKPLCQGGHLYTRIRLGSGPEIAGLVGISLWSNRFVKRHKLDHTWRSMMFINILKALRHPTAKTSASLCLTRCFPIFSAHGILFGLSHPLTFWISVFYGPHIVKCWPPRIPSFFSWEKYEPGRGIHLLNLHMNSDTKQYIKSRASSGLRGQAVWGECSPGHSLAVWLEWAPLLSRVIFILSQRRIFFSSNLSRISKAFQLCSVPFFWNTKGL